MTLKALGRIGAATALLFISGCSANKIESLRYGNQALPGNPVFIQEGSGNRLNFVENALPSAGYYAIVARYVSPRNQSRLPPELVRGVDASLDLSSLCSSLTELNFERRDLATVSMVTGNTNRFGPAQPVEEQIVFEFHMLSATSEHGNKCIEGTKEYHLSPVKVWNNQYPVKVDVKLVSSTDVNIPVGEAVNVIVGAVNSAKNILDPTGGAVFSLSSLERSETIGQKIEQSLSNNLSLEAKADKTLTFFTNGRDKANTKFVPLLARVQLEGEDSPRDMNAGYVEVRVVVAPSVMKVRSWRANGFPDLSNTVYSEVTDELSIKVREQQLDFDNAMRLLFAYKEIAVGDNGSNIVAANVLESVCDDMLEGLPYELSDIDKVILVEKLYEFAGVEEYPPVWSGGGRGALSAGERPDYLNHLANLEKYRAQFTTDCFKKYAYIYPATAMRYQDAATKAEALIDIARQRLNMSAMASN